MAVSKYHSPLKGTGLVLGELVDSGAVLGKMCDEHLLVPERKEMYTNTSTHKHTQKIKLIKKEEK